MMDHALIHHVGDKLLWKQHFQSRKSGLTESIGPDIVPEQVAFGRNHLSA
jgi:hypothetical protein